MRQLSPAFVVTSLALVVASGSASAQTAGAGVNRSSSGNSTVTSAPSETNGLSGSNVTAPVSTSTGNDVLDPGAGTATSTPAANADPAVTSTPLFELVARQGTAKEAARRARGMEPRVYGIAPRTDRDLTHQMPDDPVIRY